MHKRPPNSALEAAQLRRGYVHFDTPLSHNECKTLVCDPAAVSKHSFYPFLRHDIVRTKFKRNGHGQIKISKKIREIRYAAHADAAIYAYYNFLLSERYEAELQRLNLTKNVIAFRALGLSNVDFAQEAFEWIDKNRPCVALGFDVQDFFGSLDHRMLRNQWAALLNRSSLPDDHYAVYRSLTRYSSVEVIAARKKLGLSRSQLVRSPRLCSPPEFRQIIRPGNLISTNTRPFGIPQGSPISAALSNIYMLPFDKSLKAIVEEQGGLYRRYCDDILIVVPGTDGSLIRKLVDREISALKLNIQHSKTSLSHFAAGKSDTPLPYLGLIYDGIQVTLRASGVTRFYLKMRRGVKQLTSAKKTDGGTRLAIQRKKLILNRYSQHVPQDKRSYFRYVRLAERKTKSPSIIHQLRLHRRRLRSLMQK